MVNCFGYFQFSSRLPRRLSFIKTRNELRMPRRSSLTEYICPKGIILEVAYVFCCRLNRLHPPFSGQKKLVGFTWGKGRRHTCISCSSGGGQPMKTTAEARVSSQTSTQRYLLRSFSALCHWGTRYKENEELLKDNLCFALVWEYQEERQRSEVWKVH